jgi:hypothetical protein
MTHFALFFGDHQISKAHRGRDAAMVEAFERGLVWRRRGRKFLLEGYAILPCPSKS